MVPLVNKFLRVLVRPFIQEELSSLKLQIEELNKRVEALEVPLSNSNKQIKELSVAVKGIYDLLSSVIHISSKR